jgi:hypothetical protein
MESSEPGVESFEKEPDFLASSRSLDVEAFSLGFLAGALALFCKATARAGAALMLPTADAGEGGLLLAELRRLEDSTPSGKPVRAVDSSGDLVITFPKLCS